jgi:LacI family transcriptional regulator
MSVTQKDLADALGVSQMTVSRALHNHPHVEESVRKKVLEAARKMGYSAEENHAAETLRRRRGGERVQHHILCAMLHIPQESNDEESFHGRILKGISERARALNWEVLLPLTIRHEIPLIVARKQVDGVLRLLGQEEADAGPPALPLPWVSIFFDVPGVDVVTVDHMEGARMLGRHLLAQGHRNLAFIGPDTRIARQRLRGLREAGVELPDSRVRLEQTAYSEAGTAALVEDLLKRTAFSKSRRPFTALAVYNDYMAVSAFRHLRTKGYGVPAHLSLTGFDGAIPRGYRDIRVTTAAIPLEQLGREAVRLLEARLANPALPPARLVLETTLVPGETVGRC